MLLLMLLAVAHALPKYMISTVPKNLSGIEVVPAITKVNRSSLPLYTQWLLDHGRQSHMLLSNMQMVGCYLSHQQVWRTINQTSVVLEEDAVLDSDFDAQLDLVLDTIDMFDIIMLSERVWHVASGRYHKVNEHLFTCSEHCMWSGTRGYVVTPRGARKLLSAGEPLVTQIDSFISLVASYDRNFSMLWTRRTLANQNPWHVTTVWDGCLVCYLTSGLFFYLAALALYLAARCKFRPLQCTKFAPTDRGCAAGAASKSLDSRSLARATL